MESDRQLRMIFNSNCFIVDLHVVINGLFVGQMVVVLLLTVDRVLMRSDILLLFIFFIFLTFFASRYYFIVFVSWIGIIALFELRLWAVVAQGRTGKFVLFWSCYQIFLARSAFLICCLCWKLAINVASSSRLWAPLLVRVQNILCLLLLNFFKSFHTV